MQLPIHLLLFSRNLTWGEVLWKHKLTKVGEQTRDKPHGTHIRSVVKSFYLLPLCKRNHSLCEYRGRKVQEDSRVIWGRKKVCGRRIGQNEECMCKLNGNLWFCNTRENIVKGLEDIATWKNWGGILGAYALYGVWLLSPTILWTESSFYSHSLHLIYSTPYSFPFNIWVYVHICLQLFVLKVT